MARRARKEKFRSPKRTVLIATEGKVTEPRYFQALKNRFRDVVTVVVSPGRGGQSNPLRVLQRLQKEIKKYSSWSASDEAWLVVDKDRWGQEEKDKILSTIKKDSRIRLAASNPSFELWLLMHFRDVFAGIDQNRCEQELARSFSTEEYSKTSYPTPELMDRIPQALERARKGCPTEVSQWPQTATTLVHFPVASIVGQ